MEFGEDEVIEVPVGVDKKGGIHVAIDEQLGELIELCTTNPHNEGGFLSLITVHIFHRALPSNQPSSFCANLSQNRGCVRGAGSPLLCLDAWSWLICT